MWDFIYSNDSLLTELNTNIKPGNYSLDIETTGLDPFTAKILLIQIGFESNKALILDVRRLNKNLIRGFLESLFYVANKVILHNAKYDIKFLMYFYNFLPEINKIYDTMIAEVILNNGIGSRFYSLESLVKHYLNYELDKTTREFFIDYDDSEFTLNQLEYAFRDVLYLFDIYKSQNYLLTKNNLLDTANLEFNLIPAIAKMELCGIMLDTNKWLDLYRENNCKVNLLKNELASSVRDIKINYFSSRYNKYKFYDFSVMDYNPNSTEETLAILKYKNLPIEDTSRGTLVKFRKTDEFIDKLLDYRELSKLTNTYGINIINQINPETKRIHAEFHQVGTASGRLSSSSPNLQNIPHLENYRSCFVAPKGKKLIVADYSQIELRLAGEMSGDPKFIAAYNNNEDLHQITADLINRPRKDGKTLNFTILYGASEYRVASQLEVELEKAKEILTKWRSGFVTLNNMLEKFKNFVLNHGFIITMIGRRRYFDLPDRNDPLYWKKSNSIIREACNHPIQGTSADMIKIAITNIFYRLNYELPGMGDVICTIHDEIIVECDEKVVDQAKNIVEEEMIKAGKMFLKKIPVFVDIKVSDFWEH